MMIKRILIFLLLFIIMSCSSNKLALSEINFTPENISKGELLLLTMKVEDSEKIISKIIGFLRMDKGNKIMTIEDDGSENPLSAVASVRVIR